MKLLKQKKLVAVLAVLVLALASVGAYAYFTTTGTGAGYGQCRHELHDRSHGSDPVGTLYPGGSDVPVTVDIVEPQRRSLQYVGTIPGTVTTSGRPSRLQVSRSVRSTYDAQVAGGGQRQCGRRRPDDSTRNASGCRARTLTMATSSSRSTQLATRMARAEERLRPLLRQPS